MQGACPIHRRTHQIQASCPGWRIACNTLQTAAAQEKKHSSAFIHSTTKPMGQTCTADEVNSSTTQWWGMILIVLRSICHVDVCDCTHGCVCMLCRCCALYALASLAFKSRSQAHSRNTRTQILGSLMQKGISMGVAFYWQPSSLMHLNWYSLLTEGLHSAWNLIPEATTDQHQCPQISQVCFANICNNVDWLCGHGWP